MDSEGPPSARRQSLARFRASLFKWAVVTAISAFASVFGWQLPDPIWAAMAGVGTAILSAAFLGLVIAIVAVNGYSGDRRGILAELDENLGYVSSAAKWGLAGGGIGALVATALPPRLLEVFAADPDRIQVTGLVAIGFGALGIAIGILEEWDRKNRG